MPRNRQLARGLRLFQDLQQARVGYSLRELAARFGVTERTIRRDVEALEAAGVPMFQDEERRWRVLDWRREAA